MGNIKKNELGTQLGGMQGPQFDLQHKNRNKTPNAN